MISAPRFSLASSDFQPRTKERHIFAWHPDAEEHFSTDPDDRTYVLKDLYHRIGQAAVSQFLPGPFNFTWLVEQISLTEHSCGSVRRAEALAAALCALPFLMRRGEVFELRGYTEQNGDAAYHARRSKEHRRRKAANLAAHRARQAALQPSMAPARVAARPLPPLATPQAPKRHYEANLAHTAPMLPSAVESAADAACLAGGPDKNETAYLKNRLPPAAPPGIARAASQSSCVEPSSSPPALAAGLDKPDLGAYCLQKTIKNCPLKTPAPEAVCQEAVQAEPESRCDLLDRAGTADEDPLAALGRRMAEDSSDEGYEDLDSAAITEQAVKEQHFVGPSPKVTPQEIIAITKPLGLRRLDISFLLRSGAEREALKAATILVGSATQPLRWPERALMKAEQRLRAGRWPMHHWSS